MRFYEELNDFLSPERRKITFIHELTRRTSVKDLIEFFGVTHTEVDVILVNGRSVDFSYIVRADDRISVYSSRSVCTDGGLCERRASAHSRHRY